MALLGVGIAKKSLTYFGIDILHGNVSNSIALLTTQSILTSKRFLAQVDRLLHSLSQFFTFRPFRLDFRSWPCFQLTDQ